MASATIGELGPFYGIFGSSLAVAVQAPAHVHHLRVDSDANVGHIAVTALAVQARRNMGTVHKMDKFRHLCNRHPGDFFIVCNEIS